MGVIIITNQEPGIAMKGPLTGVVRIVSGILAIVIVFIIIRRKVARAAADNQVDKQIERDEAELS